jgi:hydroxymethylglutaryl-CoA reductase (NADPH)
MIETTKLPIVPGRGIVTAMSATMRREFLTEHGIQTTELSECLLDYKLIQNNIESYIGTVEIPVGIVGPLLYITDDQSELVYTAAGTLEGALVASMNRGAKAISLSGGFQAEVKWQKMTRVPLFELTNEDVALEFIEFVEKNVSDIRSKAESYSNHAKLAELITTRDGEFVHVKFVYTTGDASGQNMTTTCTWHAMLFMVEKFQEIRGHVVLEYIIEGNGSSDKKVSEISTESGRGIHVTAECFLSEKTINEVLRTTSDKMLKVFHPSKRLAKKGGMFGYNINVANAIAAIFLATGQDMACVHESSVGFLHLEKVEDGLMVSLTLPNLVIATIGGGTHLPKQSEALRIMGCKGNNTVQRFAKLIAGFALGLEISTYSAIVSGEFAKAHEKLGRNKPIDWLTKNELSALFLKGCLNNFHYPVVSIELKEQDLLENGILTHIAGRVTKKLIGFETLTLKYEKDDQILERELLLKSKATDVEVIKGLHMLAASIDPGLSDLIRVHAPNLEYKNCHLKETEVYTLLSSAKFSQIPQFFGAKDQKEREIHLLLIEFLDKDQFKLFNSENSPEKWTSDLVYKAMDVATSFHEVLSEKMSSFNYANCDFEPWSSNELYNKMIEIIVREEEDPFIKNKLEGLKDASFYLKELSGSIKVPKTIAVSNSDEFKVYDWELSVKNYPHRDIVELLAFVLKDGFQKEEMDSYFEYHFNSANKTGISRKDWFSVYEYSLIDLIITRLVFYEVAGIVVKYEFSNRVLKNALGMLNYIREND